jgi:hypothetical protein
MTHHERRLSPISLCISIASLVACELPGKLGELPGASASAGEGSSSGGEDQGAGEEPTTGAPPPSDEAACDIDGGLGQLLWSRERDELPDFFRALAATPGGEVAAIGRTSLGGLWTDVLVQVYDATGAPRWSRTYSGTHEFDVWPHAVAVDGAGNVHVMVLETVSMIETESGGFVDLRMVVLRYTPDGELVWRWEHERPPVASGKSYFPQGALGIVGDRIVMIETEQNDVATRTELDAQGAVLGEVELAVPSGEVLEFSIDPDGSLALAGDFEDEGTHGIWVGRYAADGSQAWIDKFGSLEFRTHMVLADQAGGVYFAWMETGVGPVEHRLRRYGPDGAPTWTQQLPMTAIESGVNAGVIRCDGALVLTGAIDRPVTPDLEWNQRQDLWLARFDADGAMVASVEHFFGPPFGFGEGEAIAATPDGELTIAGEFLHGTGDPVPWFGRFGQ